MMLLYIRNNKNLLLRRVVQNYSFHQTCDVLFGHYKSVEPCQHCSSEIVAKLQILLFYICSNSAYDFLYQISSFTFMFAVSMFLCMPKLDTGRQQRTVAHLVKSSSTFNFFVNMAPQLLDHKMHQCCKKFRINWSNYCIKNFSKIVKSATEILPCNNLKYGCGA